MRSPSASSAEPAKSAWRLALGLLLTPAWVGAALAFAPHLHVGPRWGDALAFAGATLGPITSLAIAATSEASIAFPLGVAALALPTLVAVALTHPSPTLALLLVDSALVAIAWSIGANMGRRVQHPGHLLPACVVAASADLMSLLSPEGPSHAIAASERALSVLAIWFPVPGSHALAPALGIGDLLFLALTFGAAAVHRLPYARMVGLTVLGTAAAGAASARLGSAVPALVPIAAAVLIGQPLVRQLRPEDRGAAKWSIVIAAAVVLATVLRASFAR